MIKYLQTKDRGGADMLDEQALLEFVEPYYIDKDIMHNMWHIELVNRMVKKI